MANTISYRMDTKCEHKQGMVTLICNSNTQEAEADDHEFKASPGYIVS